MLISGGHYYGQKGHRMKKLAICIPNYNRPKELSRLLRTVAEQITSDKLHESVEVCVSDDCSIENIKAVVEAVRILYSEVNLKFHENESNMGMDYNFLNCVQMSDAEYCWIIGNDDLPEENGLRSVLEYLNSENEGMDILVGPFDVYDENDRVLRSVYPLRNTGQKCLSFNTVNAEEYADLLEKVNDGNALFCFLSNVIFRRDAWMRHGDMFSGKMNSIFIQMYMNLQTLKEGAVYKYVPDKFIRNYADDEVNATFKREYDVLIGLNGVVDYFFTGEIHRKLQKRIVDGRINGRMWDTPDDSVQKQQILQIKSPKNELYKNYFIASKDRSDFFENKNVLVYGAGDFGKKAVVDLKDYNTNGIMIFDADVKKWGQELEGIVIHPAKELYLAYHSKESIVVVANNNALIEIIEMLCLNGVEKIAIIT